jgi:hypothetical protein
MERAIDAPTPRAAEPVDPPAAEGSGARPPIAWLDPGWLYLLAGIVLLAATVLIPAADDLASVRNQRDRALAIEQHRVERLANYQQYLVALEAEDPSLVRALAACQLNQIPANRSLILETPELMPGATATASIFAALEPATLRLPDRRTPDSILFRWTTSDTSRTWLIAAGAFCLLMGLLPKSRF